MAYQVLARKYRPQTFEQMIGQSHVALTLANALKSGKIAHAYLFSGPRGVGKTTSARLLAKALNCEKGPTPIPCNECESCKRITLGQEMIDILEIDAASNRGIEEIRELRENVRYAPAHSRYKVYIVDEAHQITHDAFNAFLKTLEEPPPHAIFILATTEHQKIPATILSRCQMFRFKRVSPEDIAAHLAHLLEQEKIKAEPQALARLARAAGGSVRDSLSLLDQALSFAMGTLTAKQVETLLGFLPEEFLVGFASALLEHQADGVLQWVKQLMEEGWELQQFVKDFREFLRQSIVDQIAAGKKTDALQVAGRPVSMAQLLHIIKVLGQCMEDMRWNDNPQLVLELYALRLTEPFVDVSALMQRLEQLEHGAGAVPQARPQTAPAATPFTPAYAPKAAVAAPKPSAAPTAFPSRAAASATPVASAGASAAVSERASEAPLAVDAAALWKRFLAEVWKKPSVASHLERARLKSTAGDLWTIAFTDAFAMGAVQRAQTFVTDTLSELAGYPIRVKYSQEEPDRRDSAPVVASEPAPEAEVMERMPDRMESPASKPTVSDTSSDPRVQKVLDVFKGKVRD
jgi:DNA polymerase-3 subunit gamma/tau